MKILEVLTPKRKLGNLGEQAAAEYLKKNGYTVLERNYVSLGNEIDIIAKSKDTLAFIEVKTRSASEGSRLYARPAAAVTPEKQRKIIKTARYYAASHPMGLKLRLDVIEVYVTGGEQKSVERIHHIENAFNQNTANKYYR